jgi:hypothetical protein
MAATLPHISTNAHVHVCDCVGACALASIGADRQVGANTYTLTTQSYRQTNTRMHAHTRMLSRIQESFEEKYTRYHDMVYIAFSDMACMRHSTSLV